MAHNSTNTRGMQFTCPRTWESMVPMEGGRFCDSCQEPVIDFTNWKHDELIAYFKAKPDTCGQFEPHQVDPTLIPIEDVGKGVRRGFFASLTALALTTVRAEDIPAPAATEQVVNNPTERPRKTQQSDTLTTTPCDRSTRGFSGSAKPYPNDKRVYLSMRFPFIHVRHRNVRGRVRFDRTAF
jgi:hypothetical protein